MYPYLWSALHIVIVIVCLQFLKRKECEGNIINIVLLFKPQCANTLDEGNICRLAGPMVSIERLLSYFLRMEVWGE